MTDTYRIDELPDNEDEDEEPTWDATDWRYQVMHILNDDIVCICASLKEAKHIAALLNTKPVPE